MTYPLEQAISAVQALPEADQDMIASLIMAELADQERWQKRFDETQPQLADILVRPLVHDRDVTVTGHH